MKTKRVVLNDKIEEIPLDASVPQKVPKNAPITIILFEDFQCPYCRKLTANIEGLIQQRPEDVRVAWYNFPMHTDCNKRLKRTCTHGLVLQPRRLIVHTNNKNSGRCMTFCFSAPPNSPIPIFSNIPTKFGLNKDTFVSCMKSAKTQAKIEKDAPLVLNMVFQEHPISLSMDVN